MIQNVLDFWKIVFHYNKKYVLILCGNILFSAAAPFPYILLSKPLFDSLTNGNSIREFLLIVVTLVSLTLLLNFIANILNTKTEIDGQKLMYSLNNQFNMKSIDLPFETLTDPQTLELRELALKAISGSNFIDMVRAVKDIVTNLLTLIGVVFIIVQVDLIMALVILVVIAINTYANSISKKVQYQHSIEATPYMRKVSYIQNVCSDFSYGKEIRINNCKDLLYGKIEKLNVICFDFIRKIIRSQNLGIKVSLITNAAQEGVVYIVLGIKVLINRTLSIGDFSMYFNAINQFKNSVISIINSFIDIKINSLYMGHFLQYMELEDEQSSTGNILPKSFLDIKFDHVSFVYPGKSEYTLNDVSFTLSSHEKISIVGPNGAGKTTIIKLLLRLYKPTKGQILINGVNINDYSFQDYIRLFAAVFQDYKLFAFSIRENLVLNNDVDEEKIREVLESVDLYDKVNTMPKGLETIIYRLFDDDGIEFSGGEGQKLSIARALYKNAASIVILDEPTAALDPISEFEVYQEFHQLTEDKAAIYISHRLSSCRFCDSVIVLKDGKIIEQGTHEQLIQKGGLYKEMYEKQAYYYQGKNIVEV